MPTPKRPPRPRPATLDPAAFQAWRESQYSWPCGQCDCDRNLRGLLRAICSHCGHEHHPRPDTEVSHVPES